MNIGPNLFISKTSTAVAIISLIFYRCDQKNKIFFSENSSSKSAIWHWYQLGLVMALNIYSSVLKILKLMVTKI